MIDLRRLQVLRAVEQCGGVTSAAHALHLTPSAVSQQLRALARDLGVELVTPDGRGVKLTPAARLALGHAHRLFQQWEEAAAEIRSRAPGDPVAVRLCGFPSALTALLIPAASGIQAEDPTAQVQLREAETPECFDLLLGEQADLALVVPNATSPPADDPRFEQHPVLDDVSDLLVPADHALAERAAVNLADAASETWILAAPERTEQYTLAITACTAAGFRPRVAHYATDWSTVLALVGGGYGVYLLPRLVALPERSNLRRIPLAGDPRPSRRIVAATRRGTRHHSPVAEATRQLARIAGELAGRVP